MLKNAKSLGELIHYYRVSNHLSQGDLARRLAVTISAISSWERGISRPGLEAAYQLAHAMNLSLDAFLLEPGFNETIESPTPLLERMVFKKTQVHIDNLAYDALKKRLRISYIIQGPNASVSTVTRVFKTRLDINGGPVHPIESLMNETSSSINVTTPDDFSVQEVYATHHYAYPTFSDFTLWVAFNQSSLGLNVSGESVQLITQGPGQNVDSFAAFMAIVQSDVYKYASRFWIQNGQYEWFQETLESTIQRLTSK